MTGALPTGATIAVLEKPQPCEPAESEREAFQVPSACTAESHTELNGHTGIQGTDWVLELGAAPPPTQSSTDPVDLDSLAAAQVESHHDRAGLAARFREPDSSHDIPSVDQVPAEDLSIEQFAQLYVAHNQPVVLTGALSASQGWPASVTTAWTDEYLREHTGDAKLHVRTKPQQDHTFGDAARLSEGYYQLYQYEEVTMQSYLESLQDGQLYAARIEVQEDLPELVPSMLSHYELPMRTAFGAPYKGGTIAYFGGGRQSTPLHYDDLENLVFVVRGSKTFKLYPPHQSAFLYPAFQPQATHYSLVPLSAFQSPTEADIVRFPDLQRAQGVEVTVHAGCMLYIPTCWWHAVTGSQDVNVTLNYWYAQAPRKEDPDCYRRYLREASVKWVKQLSTMGLPQSVMAEADGEAESMVEEKVKLRSNFAWEGT